MLLSQHPELLRDAELAAMAKAAEIRSADRLPLAINSETPLSGSKLNVYGVMPPELNTWERQFGEYLDADDNGIVLWWHRNLPQKPWSINVLLESGRGFSPRFHCGHQTASHGGWWIACRPQKAL